MTKKQRLEREIEKINEQIEKINQEIEELNNQISALNDEKRELSAQLNYILKEPTTKHALKQVHEISKDNVIREFLFSDTKTTPIMNRFSWSDKKFLIFENVFTLDSTWNKVSLIIIKNRPGVYYKYTGLTMTDLKKRTGGYICTNSLDFIKETDRIFPLYKELVKINQCNPKKGDVIAFETPCLLGGQTFQDQTGFGSEYWGRTLLYQGKEYGETTKFLIIGVIVS